MRIETINDWIVANHSASLNIVIGLMLVILSFFGYIGYTLNRDRTNRDIIFIVIALVLLAIVFFILKSLGYCHG